MNPQKETMITSNTADTAPTMMNGNVIEEVDSYKYLGQVFSMEKERMYLEV